MGHLLPEGYSPGHTYEEYCAWEGRWELIDGIPHAMSPLPTVKHQRISMKLATQLDKELDGCSHCEVSLPVDWKIGSFTVLQPDVFVACFPFTDKKFIEQPPALVVEVLSPSNRGKDLHLKRGIYEDQGVKYYVIIDPETDDYTILELVEGKYVEVAKGHDGTFTFSLDHGCKATVDFSKIWD